MLESPSMFNILLGEACIRMKVSTRPVPHEFPLAVWMFFTTATTIILVSSSESYVMVATLIFKNYIKLQIVSSINISQILSSAFNIQLFPSDAATLPAEWGWIPRRCKSRGWGPCGATNEPRKAGRCHNKAGRWGAIFWDFFLINPTKKHMWFETTIWLWVWWNIMFFCGLSPTVTNRDEQCTFGIGDS